MANTIIMSKYQGLGNDYLILDPKKNQVQLQGKKIALLCATMALEGVTSCIGRCMCIRAVYLNRCVRQSVQLFRHLAEHKYLQWYKILL